MKRSNGFLPAKVLPSQPAGAAAVPMPARWIAALSGLLAIALSSR
jgi:hypothetical protein